MRHFGYRKNYQVAEYFDVTPQTLSGWIKSGIIPPKHLIKFNQDILNKLSNSSTEIFSSDFELYNENPEIKGRLKLLNIQIQKTKYNFNRLNKSEALNELNKIIIYYNYSANMIVSKANDTIN